MFWWSSECLFFCWPFGFAVDDDNVVQPKKRKSQTGSATSKSTRTSSNEHGILPLRCTFHLIALAQFTQSTRRPFLTRSPGIFPFPTFQPHGDLSPMTPLEPFCQLGDLDCLTPSGIYCRGLLQGKRYFRFVRMNLGKLHKLLIPLRLEKR